MKKEFTHFIKARWRLLPCELVPVMWIHCIEMLLTFFNYFIEFFILSFIDSSTTISIFGGTTIAQLLLIRLGLRFLLRSIRFRLQCKMRHLRFGIDGQYNRRLFLWHMLIGGTITQWNRIKLVVLLALRLRRSRLDSSWYVNLRVDFIDVRVVFCFDFFDF